jgi:hypothetical protein
VAATAGTLPSCAGAVDALAGLARREGDTATAASLLAAAGALRGTTASAEPDAAAEPDPARRADALRRGLRAAGVPEPIIEAFGERPAPDVSQDKRPRRT